MAGSICDVKVLWGSVWRACLFGVLLGAGFGGLYGAAFGTLIFPLLGTALGFYFGALQGATVGLPLGALDGLLLFAFTMRFRNAGRPNPRRYRQAAGITCVAASLLALLTDWVLHGFPDPDGFAATRAMSLFMSNKYLGDATNDIPNLVIWTIAPMLVVLFASWLVGRFVAGWHTREVFDKRFDAVNSEAS